MTMGYKVHGWADPAFSGCLDAFTDNFGRGGELGAACAIYRHGEPVLDAWGGIADRRTGTPWTRDTAVPVFSVTKGIAALCVLMLVERGLIDLDRPVADYWPEFAAKGKDRVTVREALAHRAGVPVIEGPVDRAQLVDPVGMAARLAAGTPLFAPGSAHAYHAITIGWITSELTRRVTGQSIGAWLRQHVAGPRSLNIAIGRTDADASPVATVDVPPEHDTPDIDPNDPMARPISLNGLIVPRISGVAALVNDPDIQRAELAGANAMVDATSLARLYAATLAPVDGDRLLSAATIADACTILSTGDQWGGMPGPSWGAGLMLPGGVQPMLGDGSYGHDGMGGSLAFAHAPSGISFAYVRNRAGRPGVIDPMVYRVVDRLAEALGIQRPQS